MLKSILQVYHVKRTTLPQSWRFSVEITFDRYKIVAILVTKFKLVKLLLPVSKPNDSLLTKQTKNDLRLFYASLANDIFFEGGLQVSEINQDIPRTAFYFIGSRGYVAHSAAPNILKKLLEITN